MTGFLIVAICTFCMTSLVWLSVYLLKKSDRKRAMWEFRLQEEELRKREETLLLAQEAADAGTWDWDILEGKLHWTQELYKLFDLDPARDESSFETWDKVIHSDDKEAAYARINESLKNKTKLDSIYRIISGDGKIKWIRALGHGRYDASGQPVRMLGICVNVTRIIESEIAIRESEEKFSIMFDSAPVGLALSHIPDGRLMNVNKAWTEIVEIPDKTAAIGKTTVELGIIDSDETRQDILEQFKKQGYASNIEIGIKTAKGNRKTILVSVDHIRINETEMLLSTSVDITERKRLDEVIRDNEKRYRELFSGMIEGFCIIEVIFDQEDKPLDFRFLEINPAFDDQTGLHDATGRLMRDIAPDHEEYWFEIFGRIALTGIPAKFENQAKALNRWYEVFAYKVGGSESRNVAILFNDISERKRLEAQRQSEIKRALVLSEISKIFNESPFHLKDVFKTIARRVAEDIGDACIITRVSEDGEWLLPVKFHHPDPQASVMLQNLLLANPVRIGEGTAGRVAATGKPAAIPRVPKDKLKQIIQPEFWPYVEKYELFDSYIVPIKHEGRVLGTLGTMKTDPSRSYSKEDISFLEVIASRLGLVITNSRLYHDLEISRNELEQKVVERTSELKKALTILSGEQKRLRDLLDMLPNFVALMTPDFRYTFVNKVFISRFGDPGDKKCFKHFYNRDVVCDVCHSGGAKISNHCSFWDRTDIHGCIYEVFYFPFTDVDGKNLILVIGSDITRIRQAENDRVAREVAEQANKTKSEFLANVSHEIRTPMNAIIGFSDLLISQVSDEKQRSQVDLIRKSGYKLLNLINEILDLSKIEAGKMEVNLEPFNFIEFIDNIGKIFAQKAADKNVEFKVNPQTTIPRIITYDENRLFQILVNLLDNAVKFTTIGHVTMSIRADANGSDLIDLIISIEDTGIGIYEDQHDKIFMAFSRQKGISEKTFKGTGLGLTITQSLVNLLGGTIHVNSIPGKGSTFTVTLPGIPVTGNKEYRYKKPDVIDTRNLKFKKSLVLIADDNDGNRRILVEMLENTEVKVLEAQNGQEAFELAVKERPDLILLDIRMPLMNGYEAARKLKEHENTRSIPIIAFSASKVKTTNESDAEIFDDTLLKPVKLKDITEILFKYLPFTRSKKIIREKGNTPADRTRKPDRKEIEQVQRLVSILEDQYIPQYQKVIERQEIGQIELFGKNLNILAQESGSRILKDYSDQLCIFASNYDIEPLMNSLRAFPDIVSQLKELLKN